jgi:hypothetical protein
MIVYIPLLVGLFVWLAFRLASPEGTCKALQTAGRVPARFLAGWVETRADRLNGRIAPDRRVPARNWRWDDS